VSTEENKAIFGRYVEEVTNPMGRCSSAAPKT
jgi:hypothetical protein